jgi:hypothetical protein
VKRLPRLVGVGVGGVWLRNGVGCEVQGLQKHGSRLEQNRRTWDVQEIQIPSSEGTQDCPQNEVEMLNMNSFEGLRKRESSST